MKTYVFYIRNKNSLKDRIIELVSESLEAAEKEVIKEMHHNEEISGFAYF